MNSNNQPPSPEILVVNNLTKLFPTSHFFQKKENNYAVNNISFHIKQGEIVGLLGPNGAGKTTTIQMLLGTLKPTSGTISYFGKNFIKNRSEILQELGFASSSVQLPAALTVLQNLDIHARLYGFSAVERTFKIESLLKTFDVFHLRNIPIGHLSTGQITRILIAKAFLTNPRIVFLDEITAGLDPEMAKIAQCFFLQQRKLCNTSILLASHNMGEVAQMCDRFLIMKEGKIIIDNNPLQLVEEILKVQLTLKTTETQKIAQLLTQLQINYTTDNSIISIEINEQDIAQLLTKFAHEQISYSTISIQKPTLEDQFLRITRKAQSV